MRQRYQSELKRRISYILSFKSSDPRVKGVCVRDVVLSKDMRFAKVYVSVLDEAKADDALYALDAAEGFIRKNLSSDMPWRFAPNLEFVLYKELDFGNGKN